MKRQSILIGIKKYPLLAVCGALTAGLFIFLVVRGDALGSAKAELDALTSRNNKQLANISAGARLDEQVEYLVGVNKAVSERALPAGGLAQNLQYFYRIESELGLKYTDVRAGVRTAVPSGAIYVPLAYTLSLEADFPQIIALVRRLEHGPYFSRINNANIAKGPSRIVLTVNVDLLGTP